MYIVVYLSLLTGEIGYFDPTSLKKNSTRPKLDGASIKFSFYTIQT